MKQRPKVAKQRVIAGCIALVTLCAAFAPAPPTLTVVLDAGHGGKDPGNLGTGRYSTTEKDITLDVTLRIGQYIEENLPEVKVIYTRKDDSFPGLRDRVRIANDAQADLFISIHCDAFDNAGARGAGTYVMGMHKSEESLRVAMRENASMFSEEGYERNYDGFDPNDPDTYIALSLRQNVNLDASLTLGAAIQSQFRERVGRKDRGVKQAGFYVISYTTMPSALVELGFLTNPDEEDFLRSENGKAYMASAVYRAFRDTYLAARKEDNPPPPPPPSVDAKTRGEARRLRNASSPNTTCGLAFRFAPSASPSSQILLNCAAAQTPRRTFVMACTSTSLATTPPQKPPTRRRSRCAPTALKGPSWWRSMEKTKSPCRKPAA